MTVEFDSEPVRGLPGRLPAGEHILWQGGSSWQSLAAHVLHAPAVAAYFGLLMTWRFASALADGASLMVALQSASWALALGLATIAILLAFAAASAWTTVYTITNRRVVIRYGVAYQIALNLPFSRIDGVALKAAPDGTGDIALKLSAGEHVAYLNLWPHVRPWHLSTPEPALRCVPDVAMAARILADAIATAPASGSAEPARVKTPVRIPNASVAVAAE